MKKLIALLILSACNAVSIKPHSMDKSQIVYADRGGYNMKYAVKEELEKLGFKVNVGREVSSSDLSDDAGNDFFVSSYAIPKGDGYFVKVRERRETLWGGPLFFAPIWCAFNGFWWWEFNISIADQRTGAELLAWTGKGCPNSSVRRLRRLISELEQ